MQPDADAPMYKTSEFEFRMKEKVKEIKLAFAEMGRSITLLEELNEEHHLLSQKREEIILAIKKGLEYKQQAIDTFMKEEQDADKKLEQQQEANRIRRQTKEVTKKQTQVKEQDSNKDKDYMDIKESDKEDKEQQDLRKHLNDSKHGYLESKKFLEDCDVVGEELSFPYMRALTLLPIIPLLFIQFA